MLLTNQPTKTKQPFSVDADLFLENDCFRKVNNNLELG